MNKPRDPARAAIIDIGSNSVRLVIYAVHDAAALPYFNEKVMAGLGRGLAANGEMTEESMLAALAALRRFKAILQELDVTAIAIVATAAVREAANGPAFARRAAMILGQEITVLSGAQEGRLSALGVSAGAHEPDGLVGDLGGSSLELHAVGAKSGEGGETFQLGHLALDSGEPFKASKVRKVVAAALSSSERLAAGHKRFYAVGGAWRALTKLQMEMDDYPLHVLNGYAMRSKDVRKAVKAAVDSVGNPTLRSRAEQVSRRRAPQLPYAAIVLDELIAAGGFEEVIVSSNGLREGVLRDLLPPRRSDPLLDGAAAYGRLDAAQRAFAEELHAFVAPAMAPEADLFGSLDADERIDRAACMMADSGGLFHPDHRAEMGFGNALRAPYAAVTHAERCFIAHAVGTRYSKRFRMPEPYRALISDEQRLRARRLGACMRLGAVFSGRSAPILKRATLARETGVLVLQVEKRSESMVSQTVGRRLEQAADEFSLKSEIEFV